jgi:thioredoxin reductase/NAD-dependent dihydropyrimidine dehydrogenase PreA subunit
MSPPRRTPRVVATSDVTRFRGVAVAALVAATVAAAATLLGAPGSRAPGPLSASHRAADVPCAGCHTGGTRAPPPPSACAGCHGAHPSTRDGHAALRASGELTCAGCHGGHVDHGAVTFFPDGRAVRVDDRGARDVAPALLARGPGGFRPRRATTVPLVAAAACARCHDPARAPLAACVAGGVATCLDEHRAVRAADGRLAGRDVAWEAARRVAASMPPRPAPPRGGTTPWLGLAVAGVAAAAAAAAVRAIARRRARARDRARAGATEATPVTATIAAARRLPVIDATTCLGCDACVEACPYDVLEVHRYVAVVARPDACCGLTLCAQVCPNESLVMAAAPERAPGAADREQERVGLELPRHPGLFVVGDAGGGSLIRNAVDEGTRAIAAIASRRDGATRGGEGPPPLDVLIVGAGPAGLAAALEARARGLHALTLEQGTVAGSIQSFPRGKLVLDAAPAGAAAPRLWLAETTKEELLARWMLTVRSERPPIAEGRRVTGVEATAGGWRVDSVDATGATEIHHARAVVLAVGRRGSPRRLPLDVPAAMVGHVHYALADAASFAGRRVVLVGLGDVAMETAVALSRPPGTEVVVVHRGDGFRRGRSRNIEELRRRVAAGAVRVAWQSEVVALAPGRATVATPAGRQDLGCDAVFVMIGSEPAPATPAVDHSHFTAGKTLMMEGRLGHAVLPADSDSETFLFVDVSADAGRTAARVPLNLAIVVDKSGSMKGKRLANAMAATRKAIERLRDGDVVSLVSYDTSAHVLLSPTVIDGTSRQRILQRLTAPRAGNDTCISCGIDAGMRMLGQRPGMVSRILLLSDGLATAGVRDLPSFKRQAEDCRRMGASITTVGVDVDYDERLMAAIARDSNGGHYFVERPDALAAIFDKEMDSLTRTVANQAELVVDLAPGVFADHVFDRATVGSGSQTVIPMGAFSAGEHKTALVRLRVPRGVAGERPVAAVRLRYDDLVDQKPGQCEGTLTAVATADTSKLTPLDGVVSARVSASETAATLEQANDLFRSGRGDDATNLLRSRASSVRAQGWKAKKDSPWGGGGKAGAIATESFAKQEMALDRATRGFEPAAAGAPAPSPDDKPAKSNIRNAQADAFDVSK